MRMIFVEGYYDQEFFNMLFHNNIDDINFKQYSKAKKGDIDKFIKSINCMPNADYLFFADSDGKDIATKKSELQQTYKHLDMSKVYIVCFEIESWYCAGLTHDICNKNKIKYKFCQTDNMTKEQFISILPKKMMETSLTIDILNNFSIANALSQNDSFKYFYNKELKQLAV